MMKLKDILLHMYVSVLTSQWSQFVSVIHQERNWANIMYRQLDTGSVRAKYQTKSTPPTLICLLISFSTAGRCPATTSWSCLVGLSVLISITAEGGGRQEETKNKEEVEEGREGIRKAL